VVDDPLLAARMAGTTRQLGALGAVTAEIAG
jgi:hypothetical protein